MRGNTIELCLSKDYTSLAKGLYQYDYGQKLILTGVDLPSAYETHFSNEEKGNSKTVIGDSTGVDIPDEFLISGKDVHVWIYLHDTDSDGETEYHGVICVTKRAKPTAQTPTPTQKSVITETIAALNAGIEEVHGIAAGIPGVIDEALQEAKDSGEFDGYSPSATVTKDGSTATITITDKDGTTEASIDDGYSPSASVTKSGRVATITITDKSGTTSAQILDGQGAEIIDDAAGVGETEKTWSANKLATDFGKKYEKPDSGIPASDLSSGVQNSLGKADSAYQKPGSGIPASDIANGVIPDISGKLDKPSTTGSQGQVLTANGQGGQSWENPTGGDPTEIIDDNAGSGVTNKVWSANKTNTVANNKADKTGTVLNTTLSRGRKSNTGVGEGSFAFGYNVEASSSYSHAEGYATTASNYDTHAEGEYTIARGAHSHAEGSGTTASAICTHTEGVGTIGNGSYSHISGKYNVADSYDSWPLWAANTSYAVGDKVKRVSGQNVVGYICKTANSDSSFAPSKWEDAQDQMNYAEIIGNGAGMNTRSNARTLDWEGNERLMGDLYVNCNPDGTGGTKVGSVPFATDEEVQDIIDNYGEEVGT